MRFIINLLKNVLVIIFGWKTFNAFRFILRHGYIPNFINPRTFSEILQWQKYYGGIEKYNKYIDKYEARKYAKSIIGDSYLVPLIGLYNSVDEILWDILPSKFVIKATHGSGWNILVQNKAQHNWNDSKNKLQKWIKTSYYKTTGEINYKNIKPRIIIEEYLEEPSGDLLDYKFWCFDGKAQFIGVIGDRQNKTKGVILDLNWLALPIKYPRLTRWQKIPPKPNKLPEMIIIAEQLAAIFPFVRVDLYCIEGKIFFGELTFTPGDGFNLKIPKELDLKYGSLIPLHKYPKFSVA
ncbi:MAG TPA: ATP-grasp fold amidoligase family protein [Smithellaceae bacterium]|nr:ATP-grasp fold amidoligase family protein [Smithellaceae bacterium]HRS89386.1 ATP-grasp fold amidoligase family protein [Smithellaceae bacterium]HRV26204.1 ATP-grasp fold amidoligase family protein [Smithellaceae bacterium]